MMKEEIIKRRVIKHAHMFLERGATIRSVAKKSIYSKSTIHLDLTKRLPKIHLELYEKVLEKILFHKNIRHILGGEATKNKFKKKVKNNEKISN